MKEVEQLLVRDPKQANEKLALLEQDRAYERATLKHRGTNKWTKQAKISMENQGRGIGAEEQSCEFLLRFLILFYLRKLSPTGFV